MPRNMSFFHTQEQIKNQTKTVTRRLGWWNLKAGDILNAVEKAQGIPKGGKINKLCQIRVLNTEPCALTYYISEDECKKEGFPDMTPFDFTEFFIKSMSCPYGVTVNRIEFEYL